MVLTMLFVTVFVLSCATIALFTRATQWEKTIQRRMVAIQAGDPEKKRGEDDASGLLRQAATSQRTWLDRLLARYRLTAGASRLIAQAGSAWTSGNLALYSLGLGAAGFMAAHVVLPLLPLDIALAAACLCGPVIFLRLKAARRLKAFNDGLPDAIDLLARALRAGHSIGSAIEIVAMQAARPVAIEFTSVFQQQNFGIPFRDALLQMSERVQSKDLQFVVTAMLVQKETGGNLTEILDRTTHIIRERLRIEGEVRTHTAQGRLTGWILALLPAIMLLLLNIASPGYSDILLHDPTGQKLLYAGGGLILMGGMIIRKIVDIKV